MKKHRFLVFKNLFKSDRFMSKSNRIYLLVFLILIILIFLLLITTEIFNDLGWWDGHFHINYYYDPSKKGHHPGYLDPYYSISRADWSIYGLSENDPLWLKWNTRLIRQPDFFWAVTQFTWLTTVVVFFSLSVRLLKYQSKFPQSLKWIISHNTLFFVTVMDTVVMVVFWTALFKNFENNFSPDPVLKTMRISVTILVHAFIPLCLLIYTSIFAIQDREVVLLGKKYFIVGILVGTLYVLFYILMAFTWDDPYAPFTSLRNNKGWFHLILLLLSIIVILFISYHVNNFIIKHFNKYYISGTTIHQKKKIAKMAEIKKNKEKNQSSEP